MRKTFIKVPKGIQFISNWEDYSIPRNQHCIVDKGVTGCGYTEYCLTNNNNIILCSPRRILMENKSAQHKNDKNIYYAENNITDNETRIKYLNQIAKHIEYCLYEDFPCKIMVSYDSLHYVISVLKEYGLVSEFTFVVDEFQSIFLDSFFKAEVELDFVETLQNCDSVIYLSATPMLDKYLEKLDQFKDLNFYKLDWSETGFVETIHIERKRVSSLTSACGKIITNYLEGNFPITINSNNEIIQSKEAVFYLNSVNDITRIIRNYGLTEDTTRIICSNTPENVEKLRKIKFKIGNVPLKDEKNPMFMFCTSTSYIGVDFYSDNASSFVFADPNLKHLALDISLDLPQIIGRQRDKSNPFKNSITIFYKIFQKKEDSYTKEDFEKLQEQRRRSTKIILKEFYNMSQEGKEEYAHALKSDIKVSQYSRNFVSISKETNLPHYNPLIEISNERAWEVSQRDYQDSITVTKSIESSIDGVEILNFGEDSPFYRIVMEFLDEKFFSTGTFKYRMRNYCEFKDKYKENIPLLELLDHHITDSKYLRYYDYYRTEGCRSRGFEEKKLIEGLKYGLHRQEDLPEEIYTIFQVGERYSMSEIKEKLKVLFNKIGITDKKPKATLLLDYFEMSKTNITLPDKTVVHGYKILSKKE